MLRASARLYRPSQHGLGVAGPSRRYASSTSGNSIRRDAYIFLGLATATGAVWYYQSRSSSTSSPDGLFKSLSSGNTFTVRVGSAKTEHTFTRKPDEEIERMLHEHEDGQRIGRPGNPVFRWDRSWVGSNEPCEDRSAVNLVPRLRGATEMGPWWKFWASGSPAPRIEGDRDLTFFSIFDGHAGDATSELLSRTMHPTLALALVGLQAGQTGWLDGGWKNALAGLAPWEAGKAWNPASVVQTLQKAFVTLDDNICRTPIQLLPTVLGKPQNASEDATGPTPSQTYVALSSPADHGACAISAVIDAENDDLYVALAGDCRAVAGWQSTNGTWRCDVVTEDQMGENPKEVERMKSEHPASEADTVISRGRIQGGLQPTRAFGDASYKWSQAEHAAVSRIFESEGVKNRKQRPNHLTPPYVTAQPEVTHRRLSSDNDRIRFIIMATDGLWDRITSEEATLLVASYLAHRTHPDIPKAQLPKLFPLADPPAERLYPAQDLPGSESRWIQNWAYEGDKNAATHLIRNAIGGADRKFRAEMLSLHGKISRYFRDDMTVTVVFFDDGLDARSLAG